MILGYQVPLWHHFVENVKALSAIPEGIGTSIEMLAISTFLLEDI